MYASKNGHSNMVETLLQHGASVDMQKDVSTGDISSDCWHEVVQCFVMWQTPCLKCVSAF